MNTIHVLWSFLLLICFLFTSCLSQSSHDCPDWLHLCLVISPLCINSPVVPFVFFTLCFLCLLSSCSRLIFCCFSLPPTCCIGILAPRLWICWQWLMQKDSSFIRICYFEKQMTLEIKGTVHHTRKFVAFVPQSSHNWWYLCSAFLHVLVHFFFPHRLNRIDPQSLDCKQAKSDSFGNKILVSCS